MSAICPGDYVECLESSDKGHVVAGRIYLVTRSEDDDSGDYECRICGNGLRGPRTSIWLAEVVEDEVGWCPCRFRPVCSPKSEIIEALKQPAPDAVRELEDA